jgi:cation diffusion facilitator CzcD-associated flavoprotein CzcO
MNTEVTIVGAGPYGLSLAAHLGARRISFRILGIPMDFWQSSMPEGMSLKSEGHASSLYDPSRSFTLSRFCAEENLPYADLGLPVTLESFISYGVAFQQRIVPTVEQRIVTSVSACEEGFSLRLDSGEAFTTRKLILAIGVGYFAHVPSALADLADTFATHSSRHAALSAFANRDVAIIGAGASALDLAALLNGVGARPVVITRGPAVQFHERPRLPRKMRNRLRAPSSGIGPGWRSWIYCHAPLLFYYLPERLRLQMMKTTLGPVGCWFTEDAVVGKVSIIINSTVEEATIEGDRVRLRLSTDDARLPHLTADHVIAATGYRVDVDRITFLDEALRTRIDTVENTPILSSNFESSVPGLYFVGPAAANSFGPLQRFAVGARFAARRVSHGLGSASSSQ